MKVLDKHNFDRSHIPLPPAGPGRKQIYPRSSSFEGNTGLICFQTDTYIVCILWCCCVQSQSFVFELKKMEKIMSLFRII